MNDETEFRSLRLTVS